MLFFSVFTQSTKDKHPKESMERINNGLLKKKAEKRKSKQKLIKLSTKKKENKVKE